MKIENLQSSRVKATFTVTPEEFENALDKAFVKVNAEVKVDGFRKGHLPRAVFEKKFGVEALYEEALNVVLNAKAQEVFADENLAPKVCGEFEPSIETKDFERGKEFEVSLSFDVIPTVELPEYKGLEVKKQVLEATEEEINQAVEQERKYRATTQTKENQVVENGNPIVFDFEGSIDGQLFDGGSAKDYELVVGSGQFIPGFEDQLIGMKKDEVKDIVVTFPENYHEKSLAGKPATFKVTLHEVKEEVLPELNDEFVKSLGVNDVNTVEELKASKKAQIETSKARTEKDRQIDDLINQILDNTHVELPQSLVKSFADRVRSQYEQQAKMYNIDFEVFLSLMGTDKETFEKTTNEQASRQALFEIVMREIIKKENLMPTQEEIETRAESLAASSKQTKDQVLKSRYFDIVNELQFSKAIDLVLTSAKEI